MVATVLSVANATKRFGGLVAVNNLSFEVHQNEVMGIIGPNGSGKTTMMNLISGALRLSEGSVSLDGRFISTLKACLLYTSPSPRDRNVSRMPSSA